MTASASSSLSKVINQIARRGWFSAWPSESDGKSMLWAAFHVHPEDADKLFQSLVAAAMTYGGKTKWVVLRPQQDRFALFPAELERFNDNGNIGQAAGRLRQAMPELEHQAAIDIHRLSEHLHAAFTDSCSGAA